MHAEAATHAEGCAPLAQGKPKSCSFYIHVLVVTRKSKQWHSFGKSKHWHKTLPEVKDWIWYGWCSIIKWLNNKGETCRKIKMITKLKEAYMGLF